LFTMMKYLKVGKHNALSGNTGARVQHMTEGAGDLELEREREREVLLTIKKCQKFGNEVSTTLCRITPPLGTRAPAYDGEY
jgi:hypothetical protein